jgi:hypothetical protein
LPYVNFNLEDLFEYNMSCKLRRQTNSQPKNPDRGDIIVKNQFATTQTPAGVALLTTNIISIPNKNTTSFIYLSRKLLIVFDHFDRQICREK